MPPTEFMTKAKFEPRIFWLAAEALGHHVINSLTLKKDLKGDF